MINRRVLTALVSGAAIAFPFSADAGPGKQPLLTPISVRNLTGVVLAFDRDTCPMGWQEYLPLRGRSIVGVNPPASGGAPTNQLPQYDLSMNYGAPTVTLTVDQLPPHAHNYHDIYYSEVGGYSEGGTVHVQGSEGSNATDYDNVGLQITRTSEMAGGGKPVPIQTPVRALLFCELL